MIDQILSNLKNLLVYVVCNDKGEYIEEFNLRNVPPRWVADAKGAKVYNSLAAARSAVTKSYNDFPEQGILSIVEFGYQTYNVYKEEDRVKKTVHKLWKKMWNFEYERIVDRIQAQINEASGNLTEYKRLREVIAEIDSVRNK